MRKRNPMKNISSHTSWSCRTSVWNFSFLDWTKTKDFICGIQYWV